LTRLPTIHDLSPDKPLVLHFTPTVHNKPYDYINPSKKDLSGRSVFITGASKGIGRATAIAFAAAGCSQIALGARTKLTSLIPDLEAAAKSNKHPHPQVLTLELDVTSPSSVSAAAERVKSEFNGLDILINNAGYLEPFEKMLDRSFDEWKKVWDVNLHGVFLVTQKFLPLLLQKSSGLKTVLNTSSIGAHLVNGGGSGYMTSKLALLRLSEFVNEEYADQGVLCYSIHPGGVMTELARGMPEERHGVLIDEPELAGETTVWLTAERREWLRARYVAVVWDMEELLGQRERIEREDLLKVRLAI